MEEIKRIAQSIASAWNGEDKYFLYNGIILQEEDAHKALDILDIIEG